MLQPLTDSTPSDIQARIEYNSVRQEVLEYSITGVDSKDSARLWVMNFRDSWVRLSHHLLRWCVDIFSITFVTARLS
jgi:hypothetical protein